MPATLSTLDLALLGLLRMQPRSGYALRKAFDETPFGLYSSSPGAIYPALKKLARTGLIAGTIRTGRTRRPTEIFVPTPAGLAALRRALASPVTTDDVARRMPELMLRFAMMDGLLPPASVRAFLSGLERAVRAHVAALRAFRRGLTPARSRSCGALALECGIDDYENRALWARRTRARLAPKGD